MKKKLESKSLSLEDQDIIAKIDKLKSATGVKWLMTHNNLSDELIEYCRIRYLELKRKEYYKYKVPGYRYLPHIMKATNLSVLDKYRYCTDITKHELDILDKKISQILKENIANEKKAIAKRSVKEKVEKKEKSNYEIERDKMMKEFLAKGKKIQKFDFGL